MNVLPKDIASVLGGMKTLGREVRDFADLDAVIEAGLPAEAVASVKELLRATRNWRSTMGCSLRGRPAPNEAAGWSGLPACIRWRILFSGTRRQPRSFYSLRMKDLSSGRQSSW